MPTVPAVIAGTVVRPIAAPTLVAIPGIATIARIISIVKAAVHVPIPAVDKIMSKPPRKISPAHQTNVIVERCGAAQKRAFSMSQTGSVLFHYVFDNDRVTGGHDKMEWVDFRVFPDMPDTWLSLTYLT